MTPAAHPPRTVGDATGSAPGTVSPPVRWWQHRAVRFGAGLLTMLVLLVPPLFFPLDAPWRLHLTDSSVIELTPRNLGLYVGLVLMPLMRKVSYRKRDLLIIVLVPIYGQFVAGTIVSRLLSLPRRDWPPRPDEVSRAVRIPQVRGAYLLRPTFAAAEQLRTQWCVNPDHQHPYDRWAATQQIGCTRRKPAPVAAHRS